MSPCGWRLLPGFYEKCSQRAMENFSMSYHLALRSLLTARRAIGGDRFAGCARHCLMVAETGWIAPSMYRSVGLT